MRLGWGYDNISPRLPVPVRDDQHIPGLSARVNSGVVLMWGIFAGFLLHFFHCNFRDVLLAPVYAPQADTLQDIIDRGIIPFVWPGGGFYINFFKDSPNPLMNLLADKIIVPTDYDEYYKLCYYGIQRDNTHAFLGIIYEWEDVYRYGKYYHSKEVLEGNHPYGGAIMDKKWPHLDNYNRHMIYYQQVYMGTGDELTNCQNPNITSTHP